MMRLAVLNSHPIQYFAPLYRRLAAEPDLDLTVYYCSRQGAEEYLDAGFGERVRWDIPLLDGYAYTFLPSVGASDRVGGVFSLVNPSIVGELARGGYDALWVHGHNYVTYLLAIAAANVLGIPVFMRSETHLLLRCSPRKRAVRRVVMSLFYRLCAACLPIGTRNAEFYRYHGVSDAKLFLVPYTVDNDYFVRRSEAHRREAALIRTELGLAAERVVVLYASKLIPRKRPMDVLLAYEQAQRSHGDSALVFVGSGSEERRLKDYVEARGLPHVYFLGFRNQSELPRLYAIADVFVLPSEDEPWGLVINEAMCAGLPIIASAEIGAVPDLVKPGFNGFSYPTGDVEELSKHLSCLLGDEARREQMRGHSRQLIANWDFERAVQGIRSVLRYVGTRRERESRVAL